MKQSRFNEEQIIGILREQEGGMKVADACRRHAEKLQALPGRLRRSQF